MMMMIKWFHIIIIISIIHLLSIYPSIHLVGRRTHLIPSSSPRQGHRQLAREAPIRRRRARRAGAIHREHP